MQEQHKNIEDEISDLKWELEHFEQEKERVRAIIGNIGGMPKFRTKLMNSLFLAIILAAGVVSIFTDEKIRLLMVELTTVMLSLKIIYMIHIQERVNHFKFWILSAIEWRINEILVMMKKEQRKS